jgi:hypothetical protein
MALKAIAAAAPADMVSLEMAALNGQLYFIASTTQCDRHRLNASAAPAPLNDEDLSHIAAALSGTGPPIVPWLTKQEDLYYFSHHREMLPLPVYRMARRDGSDTRYYIDPVSGMLIAKMDRGAQGYRWLHKGIHRMDFTAALRGRPQWDAFMLLLMSGVTVVCVTGVYLGYRRLVRS